MSHGKDDRDRADPCKVYVGGNPEMEDQQLRDLFKEHGTVDKVWIARSPPGFAFVWLSDERDAAAGEESPVHVPEPLLPREL